MSHLPPFPVWRQLGRRLMGQQRSRVEVFEKIDTSGNGYIEEPEFYAALDALGMTKDSAADRAALWG